MKKCGECGKDLPLSAVLCLDCVEILEERPYFKFVWLSLGAAAVVLLGLVQGGVLRELRAGEVFGLATLFIVLGYPLSKVRDKLREPERRVLAELGSLYTDRFGRGLIALLLITLPLIWTGVVNIPGTGASNLVRAQHAPVRMAIVWVVIVVPTVAAIASLIDQGRAFFDPRVRCTYLLREMERWNTERR